MWREQWNLWTADVFGEIKDRPSSGDVDRTVFNVIMIYKRYDIILSVTIPTYEYIFYTHCLENNNNDNKSIGKSNVIKTHAPIAVIL